MAQAAEELDFERAAALRDRIRAVSVLGKTQGVIAGVCADTDVWGLYRGQVRWGFGVLHLEEGNLLGREGKVLSAGAEEDEGETLSAVLRQYYAGRGAAPKEICVAALPEDAEALEQLPGTAATGLICGCPSGASGRSCCAWPKATPGRRRSALPPRRSG